MDPLSRNRLVDEDSPYLQQHADNPVHWQPWDDEALEAAREEDRPIFLSIGYSSCHWCHVMEEESFEDSHVAQVLNERYVPIKVDREERPAVDRLYQTLSQMVSGGGGWPLSVWLTPELKPFYVGTYFPKERQRGRTGFLDLLAQLAERWEGDRSALEERAEKWSDALEAGMEEEVAAGGSGIEVGELLRSAWEEAMARADRRNGGFGGEPKFPQPRQVDLLFRAFAETRDGEYRDQALLTLDGMASGGIYDHVGGGFHRYSTDSEWVVPHFEKMLYDNAEIPRLYLSAYRVTGEEAYASVVEETFEFLEREMRHPGGGYYATLDARSEGEEGLFYTWTPEEVEEAVDDPDGAEAFETRYGVTGEGNFEGRSVLTLSASVEEVADRLDVEPEEAGSLLAEAEQDVYEAREERTRPARDDKVIAGWNGLTVSALAETGLAIDDSYLGEAEECLEFVEENLWSEEGLSRRFIDGETGIEGFLEDYAFVGRGAIDLYGATGKVEHLDFARRLGDGILDDFQGDDGRLYLAPERTDLLARPSDLDDSSTPSSAGSAVQLLFLLDQFFPDEGYGEAAEEAMESARGRAEASPFGHPTLAAADHLIVEGPRELTLASDGGIPVDWMEELGSRYLPDLLLAPRPAGEEGLDRWLEVLGLEEASPIWKGRASSDGEPTGYGCAGRTCSPPNSDPVEALDWLESR